MSILSILLKSSKEKKFRQRTPGGIASNGEIVYNTYNVIEIIKPDEQREIIVVPLRTEPYKYWACGEPKEAFVIMNEVPFSTGFIGVLFLIYEEKIIITECHLYGSSIEKDYKKTIEDTFQILSQNGIIFEKKDEREYIKIREKTA